jgi:hypothetical protein
MAANKHRLVLIMGLSLAGLSLAHGDDGKVSRLDQARGAVKRGSLEKARGLFQQSIRQHIQVERAQAAEALLALGRIEEQSGRLDEARIQYNRVTDLFPERRGDIHEAENRLRALRHDGGQFLLELVKKTNFARGRARLNRLQNISIEGVLLIGKQKVPMIRTLTTSPVRMREDAPSLKLSKVWNGKAGWLKKGDEIQTMRGPQLDRTVSWAYENLAQILGNHDGKARFLGSTRVFGRRSYRIEFQDGQESWIEDYDAKTWLPSRAQGDQIDSSGKTAAMTLYYYDWIKIDGAHFPGRIEFYKGDKLSYEFRFKEYKLDTEIDKAIFGIPVK